MHLLSPLLIGLILIGSAAAGAPERQPVFIGLDAEFSLANSTSAQAIERGIRIAIDEINRAGGVLGGRPLALLTKDNRSVPARGIKNLKELAKVPDLVAVFGGRFSPVALESINTVHELGIIFLDPWAAADGIVNNHRDPNYIFRLSLRDSLAMPAMLQHARKKGARRVGLLLANTAWGRSNLAAAECCFGATPVPRLIGVSRYNLGDESLIEHYEKLRGAGADAIILIADDAEGAILVKEVAALPKTQRQPIISHWGVTGGNFAAVVGDALSEIDFSVVQTFSFFMADQERVDRVLAVADRLFGLARIEDIESPVGLAHAYDLTHILALAIDRAGTTERAAVRNALEQVENYHGLVKFYRQPFSPSHHDALGPDEVFMATYRPDGTLVPLTHEK